MEPFTNYPPATFETVWAALQETDRLQKENARQMEKSREEYDRQMKESREEYARSRDDYDRRMKKFEETMGAWSNNHGSFAEEYFFNSFDKGKHTFFGEKFDEIEKNVKGIKKGFKDEYDILLINGTSIGIVEVKFTAHINDLPKTVRKAETLRANFPEYQNHKIYLGLATMSFYPALEQQCINKGIAVIKQAGDTVVINDTHLRAY